MDKGMRHSNIYCAYHIRSNAVWHTTVNYTMRMRSDISLTSHLRQPLSVHCVALLLLASIVSDQKL